MQTSAPLQGIERHWKPRLIPRDVLIGKFEKWIRECSRKLERRIDYVAALEYQKNGWPHLHPLLDVRGLRFGDIGLMGRLWYGLAGGNKLEAPRSQGDCAAYAGKYLSKDIESGDVIFSRGIARVDNSVRGLQVTLIPKGD